MKKLLIGVVLTAALLAGCNRSAPKTLATQGIPLDSAQVELPKVQTWFVTPALQQLIDSALQRQPDYLSNLATLQQARAELMARKYGLLPALDVFGGRGLRRFGEYTMDGVGNFDTNFSPNIRPDQRMPNPLPDYQLSARLSWELDVWGRLSSLKRAAAKRYLATEAGLHWQKTLLVAEIATTYYELRTLNEIQTIVKQNETLQLGGLNLVKIKLEAGRVTALAVQQFEAQLAETQALFHALEGDKLRAANRLNLQMGQVQGPFSDSLLGTDLTFETLPFSTVPAKALLARPDVKAAALQLEAAGADVKAAEAAFFPQLVLGPEIGFQSFNPAQWLSPASLAWNLVGGITAPVFARGNLRADLKRAQVQQTQAFQAYRKAALTAYTELLDALQQDRQLALQLEAKQRQVSSLKEGVKSATELFAAGYATYLEVVLAQNNVLAAEIQLAQVRLQRKLNQVQLYRALGGGW
ncbi:MAG: TolC family protein [Sphingobacteriaceae bacterium]|nr:TolC family protein [Sphingobacteriaceae bacterium]